VELSAFKTRQARTNQNEVLTLYSDMLRRPHQSAVNLQQQIEAPSHWPRCLQDGKPGDKILTTAGLTCLCVP
jgi:hypothetical protein